MKQSESRDILLKMEKEKYSFGQAMRLLRQKQGITIRKVANEVKKTATYISDIERGNNKPPEKELMRKILAALELHEVELQNYLYDLAAQERGGVSEDIADYIMNHGDLRLVIRMTQQWENGDCFWSECVDRLKRVL